MKNIIQQIIRTASLTRSQKGYNIAVANIEAYVSPMDYLEAYDSIDWLSQNGSEGI